MIHRYWHDDSAANVTWTKANLPEEIIYVLDSDKTPIPLEYKYKHEANLVRWHLLRMYGGWWLDCDVKINGELPKLDIPALALHYGTNTPCPSIIFMPKANHPLALAMCEAIPAKVCGDINSSIASGGMVLGRVVKDFDYHGLTVARRHDGSGFDPEALFDYSIGK